VAALADAATRERAALTVPVAGRALASKPWRSNLSVGALVLYWIAPSPALLPFVSMVIPRAPNGPDSF